MTVYGPYTRNDGRKHVIHYDGKTRRTQSYPRYLMEQHLDRELEQWEHVDHVNNDPTDDRIENLQLLTQQDNNKKSRVYKEYGDFVCPTCGDEFMSLMKDYRYHQVKKKKRGPYCSKSCAGKAGMVKRQTQKP